VKRAVAVVCWSRVRRDCALLEWRFSMRFRSHNGPSRIGRSASWSASSMINKPPLQRRSKALTQMRTWISCHRSLLAWWVLYAASINMTNAVDSLNVENIVEGSRCPTALAFHAGIPEPIVLRFEEGGGSLPPHGSLWRKEYQGEPVHDQRSTRAEAFWRLPTYTRSTASSRSTEPRVCP
jgi:hypothetical protein